MVVLKNCEPELSYIPAEFWRSLVFQIVGRFHRFYLYLRILGKDQQLKNTALLLSFFLWLVKCEELVNNRTVDHLDNCDLFYSQYRFGSFWLIAGPLTVVSDRICFSIMMMYTFDVRVKTEFTITWIKNGNASRHKLKTLLTMLIKKVRTTKDTYGFKQLVNNCNKTGS